MTLKALLRVRLLGLKASLTGANRTSKKRSKASILGFSILMIYCFGYFAFMMYMIFSQLAGPFSALGYGAIYFALAAIMSFCLMFIGSVFTSKTQLYEATDNDLLLSMPVRPGDVLLSRLLTLLLMDLGFGLIVSGPAIYAWAEAAGFRAAWFIPCLIVLGLLLPLLALLVAAFFGWLLHLASARVRNQSLLTIGLSLAFLAVYFVAISRMNIWISELAKDPSPLAGALGSVSPLVWLGRACADGDLPALGGLLLGTAALALLGWIVLERSFLRTATDKRGAAKVKYVEKRVDAVSPDRALLRRELKHLASSPAYIMNSALGAILTPVAAVFLILKRESVLPLLAIPGLGDYLPMMMLLGLCFLSSMCTLTAPSVSLEGKSLWLLKSLPVTPRQALNAKLRLHLLIGLRLRLHGRLLLRGGTALLHAGLRLGHGLLLRLRLRLRVGHLLQDLVAALEDHILHRLLRRQHAHLQELQHQLVLRLRLEPALLLDLDRHEELDRHLDAGLRDPAHPRGLEGHRHLLAAPHHEDLARQDVELPLELDLHADRLLVRLVQLPVDHPRPLAGGLLQGRDRAGRGHAGCGVAPREIVRAALIPRHLPQLLAVAQYVRRQRRHALPADARDVVAFMYFLRPVLQVVDVEPRGPLHEQLGL